MSATTPSHRHRVTGLTACFPRWSKTAISPLTNSCTRFCRTLLGEPPSKDAISLTRSFRHRWQFRSHCTTERLGSILSRYTPRLFWQSGNLRSIIFPAKSMYGCAMPLPGRRRTMSGCSSRHCNPWNLTCCRASRCRTSNSFRSLIISGNAPKSSPSGRHPPPQNSIGPTPFKTKNHHQDIGFENFLFQNLDYSGKICNFAIKI